MPDRDPIDVLDEAYFCEDETFTGECDGDFFDDWPCCPLCGAPDDEASADGPGLVH